MFDKQQRKLKRSGKLISVLSKYGFKDIIARMNKGEVVENVEEITTTETVYERIRLALEELGPTFVKLGQSFSNREDLLPLELIEELQKLQDNVETVDLDIRDILEAEFDIKVEEHFSSLDTKPLATASIAQVYKGILITGEEVILKIKKPNVQNFIEDDLLLIKDLVKLIYTYSEIGDQLNLKQAVATFEKSLLEEMSLVNERNNIKQFAINFKNNKETYVPKVYDDYSNNDVLCMEFIKGTKITNKEELSAKGMDLVTISEVGLRLFVAQILDYGFFHADPHAGNILITDDKKVVFIDFGAVGKIQPNDKEVLEALIVSFVAKSPSRIVRCLKKIAITYNIPDEKRFENDVAEVLNFIHSTSLKEIDTQVIIEKMQEVLKVNRLYMPDYFYLLFKGVGLIEGVGRTINPDLDILNSLKPYSKRMLTKKLDPQNMFKNGIDRFLSFTDDVDEIPKELRSILGKLDDNKFTIASEIKNIEKTNQLIKSSIINIILAMVLAANIIATSIVMMFGPQNQLFGTSYLAVLGVLFSVLIIIILTLRVLRK